VEQQVTQVKPHFNIVGPGAGDRVVQRLGLAHRAIQPGTLRAQHQVIVRG
jgi:hypothetical protein